MYIIGIDPGTQFTGYGVIVKERGEWRYQAHGVVAIPGTLSLAEKLAFLSGELAILWQQWRPAITVIEQVFLGRNVDSAFKLGHARGVCLMMAAKGGSSVVEYAARTVKKNITGSGSAEKDHVQLIVEKILGRKITGRHDASDALALAICHGWHLDRETQLSNLEIL